MHVRLLKLTSLVLCCILLFASCSGNGQTHTDNSNQPATDKTHLLDSITLPFSSGDTLNPYTAATKENQEISSLLFDSLIYINQSFEPELQLASNIDCDGTTCTITLREAKCYDGVLLTAEDVSYTIGLILENESRFFDQLSNIETYRALNESTIVLTLDTYDPYFANNLDFPIIRKGTYQLKDDNNRALPPIGCGKYQLINNEGKYHLEANPHYYKTIELKQIELTDCPDDESLYHAISLGNIDCFYSNLSDNYIPSYSGSRTNVALNNLVFLGINCDNPLLNDPQLRQTISLAIDRQEIVSDAYFNYAQPASGLFHPNWDEVKAFDFLNATADYEKSVAYLAQLGYNTKDIEGYFLNSEKERLQLRLLYNSDNSSRASAAKQVYKSLIKSGIEVNLEPAGYNEYLTKLKQGDYDMYIGEIRIANSMNLYSVFQNEVIYGIRDTSSTKEQFIKYYDGDGELGLAINAFNDELPFIPLCYRYGVLTYNKNISDGILQPSNNSCFHGIENVTIQP